MTRILLMADTHMNDCSDGQLEQLIPLIGEAELILHAGDIVSPCVHEAIGRECRLSAVAGNCDHPILKKKLPERCIVTVDGIRIGLVHEASQNPCTPGADLLSREMDVQVLVYGHIHRPAIQWVGGRLLICPGSPTKPRQSAPSVAFLDFDEGRVRGKIVNLGPPTCSYLQHARSLLEGLGDD